MHTFGKGIFFKGSQSEGKQILQAHVLSDAQPEIFNRKVPYQFVSQICQTPYHW